MRTKLQETRRRTTAAVLSTICAGLAACGGGDDRSTAGQGPVAANGALEGVRQSASAQDRWDLQMARCLRTSGIQIDDPVPGRGFPTFERPANYVEISGRCQSDIGPPPSARRSSASDAELREGSLTYTRCLRGKGYDIEDAAPGQAIVMRIPVKDADSDACLKAQSKR